MENIVIKNACIHNLKNFDISIPKNKITIATGVSGSGKSSLMFDIIFEEGRKQYLQSLGIFPGIEDEKKFDSISGISPTIAVKQSIVRQSNPRSTVGSRTRILNQLAMLYHIDGDRSCPNCKTAITGTNTCPKCGHRLEPIDISDFSYNSPNGMCKKCYGKGSYFKVNIDKLVSNSKITVREVFRNAGVTPGVERALDRNLSEYMDMPYAIVPDSIKKEIEHGHFTNNSSANNQSFCLSRILRARKKKGEYVDDLYQPVICDDCNGYRLSNAAQNIFICGKHIGELGKMTLDELKIFLVNALTKNIFSKSGFSLITTIIKKVNSLINSHLGHLTLYREISSLSSGEIQRIFLNMHLETHMDSLIYILDEPSSGLHELEKEELLKSIRQLKSLGNTVIIVEHDPKIIKIGDHIVDIGPNAGIAGGQVVYEGNYEGLLSCTKSLTGRYLSGMDKIMKRTLKTGIREDSSIPWISLYHAKTNNLKDITVSFPLCVMVGVAGVSGSGKSSLVSSTLIPMLRNYFNTPSLNMLDNNENEFSFVSTVAEKLSGLNNISGFSEVSQAPIGRNINSSPVTYLKIWDKIRTIFSQQELAKELGLNAGHFSFNSEGACPECGGSGRKAISLGNNIKTYTTCDVCKGQRYNSKALQITYKGKNISEILNLQISEALELFEDIEAITHSLKIMKEIGMGYIKLGQPTSTLSGGEAQRLKLAKEIAKNRRDNTLYVMDEPTTGLSLYDTDKLIKLLNDLVLKGNSVLIVEHNINVLRSCDWIIELGPEGGSKGGNIIAAGSPLELSKNPNSKIGRYLNN